VTLEERLAGITTVSEYQAILSECTARMQKIQDECRHPETEPVMYSWRPGAFHPTLLCTTCKASVVGITEDESDKVWDNFYNGESQLSGSSFTQNQGED
jgi:hypothetical protein